MHTLRAYWTIKTSVLPSRIEEITQSDPQMNEVYERISYTDEDFKHDAQLPEDAETTRFMEHMKTAHDRAQALTNPARVNVVTVEFTWL